MTDDEKAAAVFHAMVRVCACGHDYANHRETPSRNAEWLGETCLNCRCGHPRPMGVAPHSDNAALWFFAND